MGSDNKYDLEERTYKFAKDIRSFIKHVPKTLTNVDDCKQLGRASGSVGANYIEANEAVSRKDFIYRIKICRKEIKESRLFLKLIDTGLEKDVPKQNLINEAIELEKIFGAIIRNSSD
ncbi:four helix bundle protein [Rhodohalobacter sp.]|uniref:four helix bundle protein n=1 Tax=Rhodohalobacter sp. TaxID=1974210 RepID=UPI002ACEAD09|nr:four helix bundle protein [Rhodohalobacter sp.]MDZ7757127.1 four helix bundle protein [Rhodohalobacter sp.]